MVSSRRTTILLAVAVFIVAAAGAFALMSHDGSSKAGGSHGSAIWSVGDKWTVKVEQDSASISPDTKKSTALIPFHFEVVSGPKGSSGAWLIRVKQDGAAGPFQAGWRLEYTEQDGAMVLTRVGAAGQRMIEADVASIVLGASFPYELKYTSAPKDATLTSKELAKRSTLPKLPKGAVPTEVVSPTGGAVETGAKPPKDAPILKAGEVPPGAPPAAVAAAAKH